MADISLKEYLENIKALLDHGEIDAVVHHCRHILRYYPKNVHAYRFLGQALLDHNNLKEAAEIFRRVLSVYPDDKIAHASLSVVNERQDKGREAIWHLERVFEQDQSNSEVAERLRTLYRRYRQVDQARLQLTAGAVARQYERSGMHAQAIETLQSTLERAPGRTDLRLMLAKTFWESGVEVESAETALEVLKMLPDCAEANELMTRLWLMEGRPSDAQRYLNRVEAVDPYLAYRIAQNTLPPDNAFQLPELDYGTIERKRIATEAPEWLGEISGTDIQDDWMQDVGVTATEEVEPADDRLSSEIPADWLLEDVEDEPSDVPMAESGQEEHTGFTGLLSALGDEEAEEIEEMPSDFFEIPDEYDETEAVEDEGVVIPDDFFDQMPQALEEPETPDNTYAASDAVEESAEDEPEAEDPFAWMQETDVELTETGDLEEDENDPLEWMRTSGIEITDTSNLFEQELLRDEGEMNFQDPEDVDPLAWMHTSGIEFEEGEVPDFFNAQMDTSAIGTGSMEPASDVDEAEDPMAWLDDSEEEAEIPQAEETPLPVQDSESWIADDSVLDEVLDMEELTQTGDLTPPPSLRDILGDDAEEIDDEFLIEPERRIGPTEILPGSDELNVEDTLDWQSEMSDQHDFPDWLDSDDSNEEEDGFEWLEQSDDEEALEAPMEGATGPDPLDWMSDPSLEESLQETESESNLSWLDEEDEALEEKAETPQWMAGIAPGAPDVEGSADELFESISEEEAEPVSETPDWLAEAPPLSDEESQDEEFEGGELEWLSSDEDEEEAEAISETPDWLAGVVPSTEEAPSSDFEWVSDEDEEEAVESISETPDWLAEAAPLEDEMSPQEEVSGGQEFEWLGSDEDEEEAEAVSETPDWLAEAVPSPEEAPSSDFEWVSDEDEEEIVGETPDWLAEAAPLENETPQEAVPGEQEFEWLSSDADEEVEAISETPDWLAEAAPLTDEEPETEAVQGEQFEWLSSDEDEEEAETVSETPDWLAEAAPLTDEEPETEAVQGEQFEWMSSDEDEEEAETVGETPDWLAEAAPLTGEEPETEAVQGEQFEWMSSDEDEEEAETVGETPDWLAEAAPLTDEMFEGEEEAQAEGEMAWSSEDEEFEPANESEGPPFEWYRGEADIATAPLSELQDEPEFDEADTSELTPVTAAEMESGGEEAEDEIEQADESPVWLADALSEPVDPDDFAYETDVTHSEFGWIGDEEGENEAAEAPVEAEAEAYEEFGDEDEKVLATAPAPPPAENAPD
ncbi:MAG: tetratricopeptide repeat protein, partial [Anaerolineae bacterium]|nr:tetratricopeptide repeat protein [Anaerolineae bacterium]